MTKPSDDLEAVRLVIQALEPFDSKDRDRIIRWACEKLGMPGTLPTAQGLAQSHGSQRVALSDQSQQLAPTAPTDIKGFILSKNPRSENHFAAVVAYYYHFQAPSNDQRDFITKDDLLDAARKADRKRPNRPAQVLVNTYHAGLLDKTGERGQYRLNSVGENLVAMVLPENEGSSGQTRASAPGKRASRSKSSPQKWSRKKSPKNKTSTRKT